MKTTLRDDLAANVGSNGKPALAGAIRGDVKLLNDFNGRARPLFNWWGGNANTAETIAEPQFRGIYLTSSAGRGSLGSVTIQVPIADAAIVPQTGLIKNLSVNGVVTTQATLPQNRGVKETINEPPSVWYPQFANWDGLYGFANSDYTPGVATAQEVKVQIGTSPSTYGPQVRSGLIVEMQADTAAVRGGHVPTVGGETLPLDGLTTGNDIIGTGILYRDIASLRDFYNRVWRDKRIHFGWSMCRNDLGTLGVSISSATPRYILNTQYGPGSLTPTIGGPGIAVPLCFAAQGRRTTVRIYIRVFARMAGGGTGSLSVYNRDNSGGMSGPTAVSNSPTISGSTYQWYPNTTTWSPDDPWFLGNANPNYASDHILPCAQTDGGSAVEIAGFTMAVRPVSG
jgi:hypothetical protein